MFVTGRVSFFDTTAAPPSYGAGRLNSAIQMNGFADRIECFAPTAVCFRTVNARWQMCCAPAFPCANGKYTSSDRTVLRGIALVDIEAVKDSGGNVVGAVNCFQDITERKRSEAQIVNLAREAEHRTKNILSLLATVRLSRADTSDDLKQLIEGRINALAKVHTLFVESRWAGAELRSLATQELSPYSGETEGRVRIDGPPEMLEPNLAQTVAISLHELATNAAKYGSLSAAGGHVEITWSRTTEGRLSLRWIESGGPPVMPPTRRGFGRSIMENIIVGQLRGEVHFDWRDQGLKCEVTLPLA